MTKKRLNHADSSLSIESREKSRGKRNQAVSGHEPRSLATLKSLGNQPVLPIAHPATALRGSSGTHAARTEKEE